MKKNAVRVWAFRASGVFERGKATCSGYMEAMDLLLEAAGIGSIRVFSNTMDHAWNLVSLDGEMRYLDATFDDPVPDQPGRVMYDFFLIEPDTLKATREIRIRPGHADDDFPDGIRSLFQLSVCGEKHGCAVSFFWFSGQA